MEHHITEHGFKRPAQECQAASFEALCIMFLHPALTSDPKMVCSLLQCCKSWRAALYHCCAGNAVISSKDQTGLHLLPSFANFATWLPKHAALVASIDWKAPWGTSANSYCLTAEHMLSQALHSAAATKEAGAAHDLRLQRFETDIFSSAAVLREIPAASLTHLSLEAQYGSKNMSPSNAEMAHALVQLANLQQLHITGFLKNSLHTACIAAVGKLCCLTQLELKYVEEDSDLGLLPVQLQRLNLTVRHSSSSSSSSSNPLALGHLTALQELKLKLAESPALGSELPPNLRTLNIKLYDGLADSHLANLSIPGQQLQQLQATNSLVDAQQVLHLASLPQLQRVKLHYSVPLKACRAAPFWKLLPQLQTLSFCSEDEKVDEEVVNEQLLQGMGAASSLTALRIGSSVLREGSAVCVHLTGLQQLRELTLAGPSPPSRADAMHLTSLTGLTSLEFTNPFFHGVDGTVVAAIACHLTQLEDLCLHGCSLGSPAPLPVIGAMLTKLTSLELTDCGDRADDDIMLLTTLPNLRTFGGWGTFSEQAQDEFFRVMNEKRKKQQAMQQQQQ